MDTALRSFRPPFCPSPRCRFHLSALGWRWKRFGCYTRQCEPRIIPRFRCRHCRITFSSQTFSTTYYLKRPELLVPVAHRLLACSGYRQIGREARCRETTVMGLAARLGRHALLYLHYNRPPLPLNERLVIDGFESFAYSQYHPLHINLAIGAESHFTYAFTYAELRRKGTMRPAQKRFRAKIENDHGRPDPKALEHSVSDLIRLAAPNDRELTIHSDEHPAYPRAFKRVGKTIEHICTPSIAARTPGNPLFPVNLMDLLLRHNSANHKRETIAFSKRHQSVVERAALLILWRNYTKQFSENNGGGTPAMRAGIKERPVPMRELFQTRLFPSRIELPKSWEDYYLGRVPTGEFKQPREHRLKRAC